MRKHLVVVAAALLICFPAKTLHAQSGVPDDFVLIATAGGGESWSPSLRVEVQKDGAIQITRWASRTLDAEVLSSSSLNISGTWVQAIWDAVESNQFFALAPQYSHDTITGRTYARLTVRASGTTHTVTTRNVALPAFDSIISEVNSHLPVTDQLIYDTSDPVPITPIDVCGQVSPMSPPDRRAVDERMRKGELKDLGEIPERRPKPAGADAAALQGAPHPGTMVACELGLEEAAAAGLVDLQGKGEYYGDAVSITADNTNPQPCNEITVRLFLEFYGPGASYAEALKIAAGIQSYWNGFSTNTGQMVNVLVDYRVGFGSSPPGTPGYHQIELAPDTERSRVDQVIDPNDGTGSGAWESGDESSLYAHEAGHLMGFEDQYEDYLKLPDGTWQREAGGPPMTPEEFAAFLDPKLLDKGYDEILMKLNEPDRDVVSVPLDDHENDLMGTQHGKVLQTHINELTQNIGLGIAIPPGSVLVPRDAGEQNLVVTRGEYLFVPPGGTAELHGIYGACLDHDRSIPDEGLRFDVAPHLSTWNGFPGTDILLQALDYANSNNRFCGFDFALQDVVWRVTDNQFNTSLGFYQFVSDAGIELDSTQFEFPEIVNPDQDSSAPTGAYVPRELYTARVTPGAALGGLGERADVTAEFIAPEAGSAATHAATWELLRPAASSATLANSSGASNTFTPDVRGFYEARYLAEVSGAPGEPAPFVVTSTGGRVVAPDDLTETFESGELSTGAPFYWKVGGSEPWAITQQATHTGLFSACSGAISDDSLSTLSVRLQLPTPGTLEFAARTSSEKDYDYLVFLVDDDEVGRWSGVLPWFTTALELSGGEHVLSWRYEKDGSFSAGADKAWIDDVFFPENARLITSVTVDEPTVPAQFALLQNYPNPFNASTTIRYLVPHTTRVRIAVYDVTGRELAVLLDETRPAGRHEVTFDASAFASGIYYYRMKAGTYQQVRQMLLVK